MVQQISCNTSEKKKCAVLPAGNKYLEDYDLSFNVLHLSQKC